MDETYDWEVGGEDLGQLLSDVIVHLPVLVPRCLSSVQIKSSAYEEKGESKKRKCGE